MPAAATHEANWSYRDVLRNRRVAGLLAGDLLANVGTGMLIVAMPVQTLSIHGDAPKPVAIGLVEAAPFVLSTILALSIGLGRVRVPPRTLLITDCVLRSLAFAALGVLAVTDRLTLQVLIIGLWAVCPVALAFAGNLTVAMIVFGLGGLVWAPFTPVAYSFLQSGLEPHEQQQVVTLWTTVSMVAAPLGLTAGGPLIELAGTSGGLVLSGVLTLLLLPIAALAVLIRMPTSVTLPAGNASYL